MQEPDKNHPVNQLKPRVPKKFLKRAGPAQRMAPAPQAPVQPFPKMRGC